MTHQEVLVRFCFLASRVGDHLQEKHANCFCEGEYVGFRFEPEIMEFIEKAVADAMRKTP